MNAVYFARCCLISICIGALATAGFEFATLPAIGFDLITFAAFSLAVFVGSLLTYSFVPTRKNRHQNRIPKNAARENGAVKWFNANKGFGFITRDSGEDIFVHFRSIRGRGRRSLQDGQKVDFVVVKSAKGSQAEDVQAI